MVPGMISNDLTAVMDQLQQFRMFLCAVSIHEENRFGVMFVERIDHLADHFSSLGPSSNVAPLFGYGIIIGDDAIHLIHVILRFSRRLGIGTLDGFIRWVRGSIYFRLGFRLVRFG